MFLYCDATVAHFFSPTYHLPGITCKLRTTWSIRRPGEILVVGEPEVELIIYLLRIVLFRFYNRGELVAGSSADYIDTDFVKEPVR